VSRWQNLQNVSTEIRGMLSEHEELRRADAQQVLQDWVEAQDSQNSPEVLCARLVKALSDVAAFCRSHAGPIHDADLRSALRAALGVPESKRPL
jgi:hypothetical protein